MKPYLMQSGCAALIAAALAFPAMAQTTDALVDAQTNSTTPPPGQVPADDRATEATAGADGVAATPVGSTMTGAGGTVMPTTGAANSDMITGTGLSTITGTTVTTTSETVPSNTMSDTAGTANTSASTQAMDELNHSRVISSLRSETDFSSAVAGIDASTKIKMVMLSELNKGETGEGIERALDDAQETLASLRQDLSDHSVITDHLEAQGHSVEDVIFVDRSADRALRLVVDDRDDT
nr:hypothetical protein [Paracoccus saliphilus]